MDVVARLVTEALTTMSDFNPHLLSMSDEDCAKLQKAMESHFDVVLRNEKIKGNRKYRQARTGASVVREPPSYHLALPKDRGKHASE